MEVESLYREPEPDADELSFGALEFHDVFKIYRSGPAQSVALRGLDLRIEPHELVAVYGPSGSGKSTMLHLAAALDVPSAGDVRALGKSLVLLDERELGSYRAHDISIIFQSRNLWPGLTARENVALSLRLADRPAPRSKVDGVLEAFGLGSSRAGQSAATLSGGEQQRVAIAAAAAREAPLVLADEPTAELDERNEQIVLEALARLRSDFGSTVVIVTHSSAVASAADRVLEIRDGQLVS